MAPDIRGHRDHRNAQEFVRRGPSGFWSFHLDTLKDLVDEKCFLFVERFDQRPTRP
jgi:hypothetical protein